MSNWWSCIVSERNARRRIIGNESSPTDFALKVRGRQAQGEFAGRTTPWVCVENKGRLKVCGSGPGQKHESIERTRSAARLQRARPNVQDPRAMPWAGPPCTFGAESCNAQRPLYKCASW